MNEHASGLTRRQVIGAGAALGATAFFGLDAASSHAASALAVPGSFLKRSSYEGLEGAGLSVSGSADSTLLTLLGTGDLAGATGNRLLRGHDEAFAVALEGPAGSALPQGTHHFRHDRFQSAPSRGAGCPRPSRTTTSTTGSVTDSASRVPMASS